MGLGDKFNDFKDQATDKAGDVADEAKEQGQESFDEAKSADSVGEGAEQVKGDAQDFGKGLKDKF